MGALSWAAHFGIPESEVTQLKNENAGSEAEALRLVILSGRISAEDYLRWAMEEYELPVVKPNFFDIPADPVFWDAVRMQYQWSAGFLPLAEWQGVLYVGCLEPPRFHFPLRGNHRFVLASASLLAKRFSEFEPNAKVVTPPPATEAAKPKVVAAAPVAAPAPEVRQRPMDEYLADSLPAAPDVSLDDPDGLLEKVEPLSNPNLFIVPEGLSVSDIGKPISTVPDGMENAVSGLFDLGSTDPHEPVVAPAPAQHAPPVSLSRPPLDLSQRVYVEPSQAAAEVKATPPPAPPIAPSFVPASGNSTISPTQAAVPLETAASFDALGAAAIGNMLKHFEQAVVFMFQGGQLRPWKWTDQLLSVKGDKPDAIVLDQPSIFRIAYRTCLPYHGHVVANPVNTVFFNAFYRGQIPLHVTLIPVLINGQIAGMLMGTAGEKVDYMGSLVAMEKLASEFGTQLDRLRKRQPQPTVAA